MLAEIAVVEILNPEIVQDLKNISEVEQREVQPVVFAHAVLHRQVDTKNKKRLYQQVDKDEDDDVEDEFAVQVSGRFRQSLPPQSWEEIPNSRLL